jgi:hypothetical protein
MGRKIVLELWTVVLGAGFLALQAQQKTSGGRGANVALIVHATFNEEIHMPNLAPSAYVHPLRRHRATRKIFPTHRGTAS